jgi:hypothetical protein
VYGTGRLLATFARFPSPLKNTLHVRVSRSLTKFEGGAEEAARREESGRISGNVSPVMEQKKPSEGRDLSSGRWHLVSNSSDLGFHLVHGSAARQECRRRGGREW